MQLRNVRMKMPLLRIAASAAILAGLVVSCGDNIVDPELPHLAKQFTPPSFYTTWWEMTKSCSGASGSLDEVTWYEVPAGVPLELDGKPVSAYWSAGSNRIVVSSDVREDGQVIRHEMLHALLRDKGHFRGDFLERCAGYVTCTSQCVSDAGPPPAVGASVPRVSAASLEVTMSIAPTPLFSAVNGGYFNVTVRARNPASNQVVAELPSQGSAQISFSYFILGPNGEAGFVEVLDPGAAIFAAGETKVHVFDFFVGNEGTRHGRIYPGLYTIRGSYGGNSAPDQSLQTH
jgi:hypothetical protein